MCSIDIGGQFISLMDLHIDVMMGTFFTRLPPQSSLESISKGIQSSLIRDASSMEVVNEEVVSLALKDIFM